MKLNERKPKTAPSAASIKEAAPRDGKTRRPMHRIYQIHATIRSGLLPNCSTLAQSLEVDRKTIQRDISFMRDALGHRRIADAELLECQKHALVVTVVDTENVNGVHGG